MGEQRYSSTVHDLGTGWRRVLSFTPLPFTPGERSSTNWIRGCVVPTASPDALRRQKILHCPESNPGRPARIYTDSFVNLWNVTQVWPRQPVSLTIPVTCAWHKVAQYKLVNGGVSSSASVLTAATTKTKTSWNQHYYCHLPGCHRTFSLVVTKVSEANAASIFPEDSGSMHLGDVCTY
jgi:hypothetical protein